MLDALPSFDPFLLREAVVKKGLDVAPCYFELSPADLAAMRALATEEVSSLVRLSFSGNAGLVAYTDRLISKILATKPDEQLEPLRHTLKLSLEEFEEGLFCWKAFLYYKWAQNDILDNAQALIEDILNIQPMGFLKQTERQYLNHSRMVTRRGLMDALDNIEKIVLVYDRAYCDLIKKGSPHLFREFLLTARAHPIEQAGEVRLRFVDVDDDGGWGVRHGPRLVQTRTNINAGEGAGRLRSEEGCRSARPSPLTAQSGLDARRWGPEGAEHVTSTDDSFSSRR